jgi:hypothetical protein
MHNVPKRTTLIVRDAERSPGFDRDVLDMAPWYDDGHFFEGNERRQGRP